MADLRPQLGAAALTASFAALAVVWAGREPPYQHVECQVGGPPEVREAWIAGAELAGFAVALLSAAITLWASHGAKRDRIGLAAALGVGALWWATGTATPLWYLGLVAMLGLMISVLVVPLLLVHIIRTRGREAKGALRILGWWCTVVLAPAFVTLVVGWESDPFC